MRTPSRLPELLPRGTPAPSFNLPTADAAASPPGARPPPEARVTLEALRGSPAVLIFYPGDFTPVCGEQLNVVNEVLPVLRDQGARVLAISVDSPWCHRAFAGSRGLELPLLSDFHPKGEVARRYRSYREQDGVADRSLFVLDREGRVFWSGRSPIDVNPGVDGILDALERLERERAATAPARETPAQEGRP